jgi:hypothetical protein
MLVTHDSAFWPVGWFGWIVAHPAALTPHYGNGQGETCGRFGPRWKNMRNSMGKQVKMNQFSPKRICDVDRKEAGRHNPPQAVTHVFRPVSGIA